MKLIKSCILLALAFTGTAIGGPDSTTSVDLSKDGKIVAPPPPDESLCDKIFGLATLYKNDNNPFIEEFDFTGRFQLDYFNVDSNKGKVDFTEIRRFRLGEDAFFFNRVLEIKTSVDTALDSYHKDRIFYNRLTDAYAQIHISDELNIKVGKFEPHFGYDREFSDNYQKFFERSFFDDQVFNKTGNDYTSSAGINGKAGGFSYFAYVLSLDVGKEFGNFKGGSAYLGEIAYDFVKSKNPGDLVADKALWALDYMHVSDPTNANSDVFNTSKNNVATYFDYQKGPFCFVTQFGYMNGIATKGDVYEAMVMPSFYIIPGKLEVLGRYTYLHGTDANSIATINRQQSTIGTFTGNNENDVYLGLNYYLCGMKARAMFGEQYSNLTGGTGSKAGFSGWTTIVGFRVFW